MLFLYCRGRRPRRPENNGKNNKYGYESIFIHFSVSRVFLRVVEGADPYGEMIKFVRLREI